MRYSYFRTFSDTYSHAPPLRMHTYPLYCHPHHPPPTVVRCEVCGPVQNPLGTHDDVQLLNVSYGRSKTVTLCQRATENLNRHVCTTMRVS
jgi:hypothetical protein